MAHHARKALAVLATGSLALGVSACATKGDKPPPEADLAAGKRAFLIKCGTCHTLNRAGTTGTFGPNLDEAFQRNLTNGLGRGGVRGIVAYQIKHANQKAPDPSAYMPRNLVSGDDVGNVAAYVADVVGKTGRDSGTLSGKYIPTGDNGRAIFRGMCRSCHTLADAGTSGSIGPDLDTNLPGQGFGPIKDSIIHPEANIAQGFRRNVMPKNYASQLRPDQVDALARYLAQVAGKPVRRKG